MDKNEKDLVDSLLGSKLEVLNCEVNMLEFCFDNSLTIHVNGFGRVIKNNDLLITTQDYQSWDGEESTHNDEWVNMTQFRSDIVGGLVEKVELSPINDLRLILDNGVTIECLIENAYPHYEDEIEQWVLFENKYSQKTKRGFLSVYNKHTCFDYLE